jgi:hypothetical protein
MDLLMIPAGILVKVQVKVPFLYLCKSMADKHMNANIFMPIHASIL